MKYTQNGRLTKKVATEVAIGAALSGSRSVTCMKHVGLNVAADPMFTASYTGVKGGFVACVAGRPRNARVHKTSKDTRMLAMAAKIPVVEPSDSAECKEYTKIATI